MNETTLFLAQLMGPTFGFIGLGMLFNLKLYKKVFKSFEKENVLEIFIMAMIMIPLGIVLVMKHFLWGSLPEIVVSVLGLAILLKGIMFGLFPTFYKFIVKLVLNKAVVIVGGVIWLIIGVYLSWVGFFV